MKIFIDTASVKEIKEAASLGLIDGVTTNPTLMAKEGRNPEQVLKEICALVSGPVSAEVISIESSGMVNEAYELVKLAKNIVVKIPLIREGLKAVKILSSQGIKTNVTLCFSVNQALLAAKAGATYISPFIGRLDDIGQNGNDLLAEIRSLYDIYGFTTKILAASIRHAAHVREAALLGADVGTMPLSVVKALYKHPLTEKGLEAFLADHKKANS